MYLIGEDALIHNEEIDLVLFLRSVKTAVPPDVFLDLSYFFIDYFVLCSYSYL